MLLDNKIKFNAPVQKCHFGKIAKMALLNQFTKNVENIKKILSLF